MVVEACCGGWMVRTWNSYLESMIPIDVNSYSNCKRRDKYTTKTIQRDAYYYTTKRFQPNFQTVFYNAWSILYTRRRLMTTLAEDPKNRTPIFSKLLLKKNIPNKLKNMADLVWRYNSGLGP